MFILKIKIRNLIQPFRHTNDLFSIIETERKLGFQKIKVRILGKKNFNQDN